MPVKLVWTRKAEEDLIEIHAFLALDSPTAADRIVDKLISVADVLRRHPRLGQRRPEIRPSVRMMTDWPYVLLYETLPDEEDGQVKFVEVVRVLDGRRDLSSLF